MSFFSSPQTPSENVSQGFPTEVSVIIKKSFWERLGSFIWGLIKIFFIVAIIGFIATGGNKAIQEFSPYEKNYYDAFHRAENANDSATKIGVLNLSGPIFSQNNGGFTPEMTISKDFIALLADTIEDEEISAVLIQINSPGGEVFASEQIAEAIDILKAKTEKPIYVTLETMAASGGYYIAASGSKIFAYPETLLGNIGVRIDIPNMEGLLEKVGVEMQSVTSGKLKTMGSPFRAMTEKEKEIFSELIDESYEKFVQRVATGRNLSIEEAKELADGRIFSGTQGKQNGLVDELVSSLSDLSTLLKKELKTEDLQFVGFSARMTPFEKFLLSVQTGMNPLSAKLSEVSGMKFLMK